jgi:hypothetical protein
MNPQQTVKAMDDYGKLMKKLSDELQLHSKR